MHPKRSSSQSLYVVSKALMAFNTYCTACKEAGVAGAGTQQHDISASLVQASIVL